MSSVKAALAASVKATASAVDVVRPPQPGLVVLLYHRVGAGSGGEIDLPVPAFEEQMAHLAASGRVVTLDDGLEQVRRQPAAAGAADAPVAVTFDDGTADFAEHALPVLVRHGIPATVYVATRFIDEGLPFPAEGRPASWAALADACRTGLVDIGSHTHGHVLLDRCPPERVEDDLDRSIELIGEHVGRAPAHFAYPKAVDGSPSARRAVRARFRSAALAGTRANGFGTTDPHRLRRSPIQRADGMRWYRRKVDGHMALEDSLRRLLNRARYLGAET